MLQDAVLGIEGAEAGPDGLPVGLQLCLLEVKEGGVDQGNLCAFLYFRSFGGAEPENPPAGFRGDKDLGGLEIAIGIGSFFPVVATCGQDQCRDK